MKDSADEATVLALEAELARVQTLPLAQRVERYFKANPGEWLTWGDMEEKFDCTAKQARDTVSYLRSYSRVDFEVVGVVRVKELAPAG